MILFYDKYKIEKEFATYLDLKQGTAYRNLAVDFTIDQLLGCHVHIGHSSSGVDPRMFNLLLGVRRGVYIINLLKTVRTFKPALNVLADVISKRGKVLLANFGFDIMAAITLKVKEACLRYFLTNKKLPGILTNYLRVRKSVPFLNISNQVPVYAVSIDAINNHVAREADLLEIPSICIIDSNINPLGYSFYPVPGNDDSFSAKLFYVKLVFKAIKVGLSKYVLWWGTRYKIKFNELLSYIVRYMYKSVILNKLKNRNFIGLNFLVIPDIIKNLKIFEKFRLTSFVNKLLPLSHEYGTNKKIVNKIFQDNLLTSELYLMEFTMSNALNCIVGYFRKDIKLAYKFDDNWKIFNQNNIGVYIYNVLTLYKQSAFYNLVIRKNVKLGNNKETIEADNYNRLVKILNLSGKLIVEFKKFIIQKQFFNFNMFKFVRFDTDVSFKFLKYATAMNIFYNVDLKRYKYLLVKTNVKKLRLTNLEYNNDNKLNKFFNTERFKLASIALFKFSLKNDLFANVSLNEKIIKIKEKVVIIDKKSVNNTEVKNITKLFKFEPKYYSVGFRKFRHYAKFTNLTNQIIKNFNNKFKKSRKNK